MTERDCFKKLTENFSSKWKVTAIKPKGLFEVWGGWVQKKREQ